MRSAMHTASQLPGRGPTDVDVATVSACCPCTYLHFYKMYLHVNKKSRERDYN